jgi:hypothetical protein
MDKKFITDVIKGTLHETLKDEYCFTEEDLAVLDISTVPELKNQIEDIGFLLGKNGKDTMCIRSHKLAQYQKQVIKKLYYAVWDLNNGWRS